MTGRRWSAGLFEKPATPKGAHGDRKKGCATRTSSSRARARRPPSRRRKPQGAEGGQRHGVRRRVDHQTGSASPPARHRFARRRRRRIAVEPPPVDAPHCATVDSRRRWRTRWATVQLPAWLRRRTRSSTRSTSRSGRSTTSTSRRGTVRRRHDGPAAGRAAGLRADALPGRWPRVQGRRRRLARLLVVPAGDLARRAAACRARVRRAAPADAGPRQRPRIRARSDQLDPGYFVGFVAAISVACCICFRAVASGNADPTSKSVCTPTRFANASDSAAAASSSCRRSSPSSSRTRRRTPAASRCVGL